MKRARAIRGPGSSHWPTPTASTNGNEVDIRISGGGLAFPISLGVKGKLKSTKTAARAWTLAWMLMRAAGFRPGRATAVTYPYTPPLQVTLRPGTAAFAADLIYNPRFVAWLMGWPPEWTSCELRVTGFPHWLRRSRTALSELLSGFEAGLDSAA